MDTIRVLIADDQELVRTGFGMILNAQADIEVVGEAADGREVIAMAAELHPDVVLMDIRMPELDGIAATQRIVAASSGAGPRVVILTTFDLDEYVYEALQAGASGFLLKDAPTQQLAWGVRMVASGDALLAPSITKRLIEEFAASTPARPSAELEELTPRELEVFGLMARGMSNGEIAAHLIVGEATVKTHVKHVLMKLDLRDRVQAVVAAYELGVIKPGEGNAEERR
jgi:DNA-binding NarL/FixJ family response regulator